MKKRFSKRDIVFLVILSGLLGIVCFWFYKSQRTMGSQIVIQIDGIQYGCYSLSENQEIPIKINEKVTNVLRIQDGVAKMIEADCPDHLCMHQKAIQHDNETIVCLPNKVVIQVISETEGEYDSIAK